MRIGILGCSDICKNAVLHPAEQIESVHVTAIASRDESKAHRFGEAYGIAHAFGSYSELMDSGCVDSVYIAMPPVFHAEMAEQALRRGLQVLVEKPACLTGEEARRVKAAASKADSCCLEGLMVDRHPWQMDIRRLIEEKKFGQLRSVSTRIGMVMPDKMRTGFRLDPALGGGILFDEAPYWLGFLETTLCGAPQDVRIVSCRMYGQVPIEIEIAAKVGNVSATFWTSYDAPYEADHTLEFEGAQLNVRNFFRASMGKYKIHITTSDKSWTQSYAPQNYYENQLLYFERLKNVSLTERLENLDRLVRRADSLECLNEKFQQWRSQ